MDEMTNEHKTHDLSHAVHVDVLCVEDSVSGHVVIGVV